MDHATALLRRLAENCHRESVKGFIAMIIVDAAELIPEEDRLRFWDAWAAAKQAAPQS